MTDTDIEIAIAANALGPKQATVDGVTVQLEAVGAGAEHVGQDRLGAMFFQPRSRGFDPSGGLDQGF